MGDVGNQIYHSFTEEDKIDKEIPVTITNDISRQDIGKSNFQFKISQQDVNHLHPRQKRYTHFPLHDMK